jgi:hypothetical protein
MGLGPNTSGWSYPSDRSLPGFPTPTGNPPAPTGNTPAAAPSVAYPTPTAETIGPPGCPGSAALMAALKAAPPSAFQAQAKSLHISGFNGIQCWQRWVVAYPITNANGTLVFSKKGGSHMVSRAEWKLFNTDVRQNASSPAGWKSPAAGPATCG